MLALLLIAISILAKPPKALFIPYQGNDITIITKLGTICNNNKKTLIGISDELFNHTVDLTPLENCSVLGVFENPTPFGSVLDAVTAIDIYLTHYPALNGFSMYGGLYGNEEVITGIYEYITVNKSLQYAMFHNPIADLFNFSRTPNIILYDIQGIEIQVTYPLHVLWPKMYYEIKRDSATFATFLKNLTILGPPYIYATDKVDLKTLSSYIDEVAAFVNGNMECDASCSTCNGEGPEDCVKCALNYVEGAKAGTCFKKCEFWTPSGVCGAFSISAIAVMLLGLILI